MELCDCGFVFSEYTEKMRTVDVSKCWPFSAELVMEDMMPPITVNKFKWWFHELDKLRSNDHNNEELLDKRSRVSTNDKGKLVEDKNEKSELASPVCRVYTAAMLNAVNEHMDECVAHVSKDERRKKVPKKRSIAEIFAVAPQIDAINVVGTDGRECYDVSEEEYNDDLVVDDFKGLTVNNNVFKKKTNRWRKQKRKVLEESSMGVDKKLKKKKKKKMKKFHKEIINKTIKKKKKNNGFLAKKVRDIYHTILFTSVCDLLI